MGFNMANMVTITVSYEDALTLRIACNVDGSNWTTKGHEANAAGDRADADTCFRLAAIRSRLWETIAEAMRASEDCEVTL